MDPMETIKQTYFQECDELLLAMEEGLIAIENGNDDNEVVNAVFRAVHSIKGGGGAFSFDKLVAFAHVFETVLDLLRSGKLAARADVVKVLLRASDTLADHVSAARSGTDIAAQADADVKAELNALCGEDGSGEADVVDFDLDFTPTAIVIDDTPQPTGWTIRFTPHTALFAKANEPANLFRELATLGELTAEVDLTRIPALDAIDPEQAYIGWTVTLVGDVGRDKVEEVFDFVTGDCELIIEPIAAVEEIPPIALFEPISEPISVPQEVLPPPAAAGKRENGSGETAMKQTIRVDLDKVDRLVNLVGELVITQAMLSQRVSECRIPRTSPIGNGLVELEHLLRELQESVMAIRTQPVKSVFQRMPRLVRELANQTNKQVHLVVEGEGTEVDKTVIERLGEPLTHMIRNAIDHGLETTEERVQAGKPPEGCVTLSAEHRGGRIVIEVSDDGRGINRSRVKEKAIERGLISSNAALSDEEIDNLIFLPGFSTASQVSNISGRGVGMDVVRRNIVDLGGRIVIGSTPGKGSRFSLTLPLTLAVLDGMVVAVGDQTFVLPLTHIVESLKARPSDIHPFQSRQLLNVRGSFVPLVNTAELLGVDGGAPPSDGVVILVESQGSGRLALSVDAIIGQHQVVIKSVESNYQHIEGIAAATILGDGRVALILDVDGLVSRCRGRLLDATELRPTGT
ncbi:MAG TPA: chemotaxis protein CheA [Rhizomicrobium sp.]|jgi:two-component system chemotaxis sensor kinase CheA|nr:chemotaxis protein CheA [Rhizomicrobium sp.]